jgi:glycine cleavage system H lipoate-binding protein
MEQIKSGEQPTLLESIKEAASLLKDIGGKVWDEAKPFVDHGRSEWAALMYTGSAYVMYPRNQQGVEQSQEQEQVKDEPEHQRDDGREL